jgi:hypothetical protein
MSLWRGNLKERDLGVKGSILKLDLKVTRWESVGWIQLDQCRILVSSFIC